MFGNMLLLFNGSQSDPAPPTQVYYPVTQWALLSRRAHANPPTPPAPFEVSLLAYLNNLGIVAYPGHIPQGIDPPAFVVTFIQGNPKYTLMRAAGLDARNYQISAFSTDYLETITMETALRNALSGYRGTMGTTLVSGCRLLDAYDLPYEVNVDASDEGTYQRAAEYRFLISEPIPTF